MVKNLLIYVSILAVYVLCDFAWISVMMPKFYQPRMEHLLSGSFNMKPVISFYLLYAFGIYYFVVKPSILSGVDVYWAGLSGALLGLIAYATYNLTNLSALRDWSVTLSAVDMAWGAFVTGLVSLVTTLFWRQMGSRRNNDIGSSELS